MITELLLNILKLILQIPLNLIPAISFGQMQLGSFAGIVELLANASIFMPVSTLLTCMSIWVSFYVFQFGMSLANWIIGKIPTID